MNDSDLAKFIAGEKKGDALPKFELPSISSEHGVILKKIFTVTTLKIYPGGTVFIQESRSWMDKESYQYKKKQKVEPQIVEKTEIKTVEEY
jgi:hypothetical protein